MLDIQLQEEEEYIQRIIKECYSKQNKSLQIRNRFNII